MYLNNSLKMNSIGQTTKLNKTLQLTNNTYIQNEWPSRKESYFISYN